MLYERPFGLRGGAGFGMYLAQYANRTYVTTYAGLASAMIALVFLYVSASIFIYGGELNAAILRARHRRILAEAARASDHSLGSERESGEGAQQ